MPDSTNEPHPFNQVELNNVVRDLELSQKDAELLGSRLNEKHLLQGFSLQLQSFAFKLQKIT